MRLIPYRLLTAGNDSNNMATFQEPADSHVNAHLCYPYVSITPFHMVIRSSLHAFGHSASHFRRDLST